MKKLFLASLSSTIIDKITEILPAKPSDLTLAFIPTARDPYHITATNDPEKEKLISMGFSIKIVELNNKTKEQLRQELVGVDLIFVAGGNTFYLLEKALESGFNELIKDLVEKGVIYIGASAGSVLVGPEISIVKDLDDPTVAPNLKTTKGLGLVDFIVLPHFGSEFYKEKTEQIYNEWSKSKYKVIPLTDRQAIIVIGDNYKIVDV